jgi:hypothetical protein
MVLGGIKEMVTTQVIQAGIQWLMGILGGPAGAFIKAAKAIYDIVMWFVNNAARLKDLVGAIIGSVSAIARGALGQAAQFIEQSLAKAIPVVIGFLASLLGLGNLGEKIRGIVEKIRAPINKAIGWVLGKAKGFASKIIGKVKGFGKKIKGKLEGSEEDKQKRLKQGVTAGVAAVNKMQGRKVTAALIKPALKALKLRYRLGVLEPVVQDGYWAVHGEIRRMTMISDVPTVPSGEPGGTPSGRPTNINEDHDEDTKRSLERENESAVVLANEGFSIEQNPSVPGDKKPDYKIEGRIFDCYSPKTNKPRNIASEIQKKVERGQADRIILNLEDSSVSINELKKQLTDYPIEGLWEIIIIKDGRTNRILP